VAPGKWKKSVAKKRRKRAKRSVGIQNNASEKKKRKFKDVRGKVKAIKKHGGGKGEEITS